MEKVRWASKRWVKTDLANWELLVLWFIYGFGLPREWLSRKGKTMIQITILGKTKEKMFIGE